MREAIVAIEQTTPLGSLRTFWWSAGALADAVVEQGLQPSFGVKQLAARIDLQIRRLSEGPAKVADRLRREVLYYVAISTPVTPAVAAVQRSFGLAGLIPTADVLHADVVGIQPHLREAREQLGQAKDTWLKFTSGRAENLAKLKHTLGFVHRHAAQTGNAALVKLTSALAARLERMTPGNVSEPVAMEYATALLLADSAFQNYGKLSADFPEHVDVMLARLDAAQASRPFEHGDVPPVLEEMSRRAQDRLLIAQVGREIQANLRHMEQVLDAFFRDHGKRAELATLVKDSAQIRGALRMLDLEAADQLLASCEEQITAYADPATPIADDDLELLAESLSGLGFYIEAVEQQRADHERLIAPLLARRRGETPVSPVTAADSVEAAVAELRGALPALVAEVHRAPADGAAREVLRGKLAVLRDDAELIGDPELAAQAKAALRELDEGGTVGAAMTALAEMPAASPAPEVSEETQRLLASEDHHLDAELLDIFLTEADEVLGTIAEQHRILGHNPADREALRTARRQFHTLKGSGRMVGLTELGEIAYDVEKIHNRLLEEERGVTPSVLALIATGEAEFRQWVAALRATGEVRPDPRHLHAAVLEVEAELPRNRDSVLKGRESALPVTAHAAVTPPVAPVAEPASPPPAPERSAAPPAPASAPVVAEETSELSDADALASVLAAYRGADIGFVPAFSTPAAGRLPRRRARTPPPSVQTRLGAKRCRARSSNSAKSVHPIALRRHQPSATPLSTRLAQAGKRRPAPLRIHPRPSNRALASSPTSGMPAAARRPSPGHGTRQATNRHPASTAAYRSSPSISCSNRWSWRRKSPSAPRRPAVRAMLRTMLRSRMSMLRSRMPTPSIALCRKAWQLCSAIRSPPHGPRPLRRPGRRKRRKGPMPLLRPPSLGCLPPSRPCSRASISRSMRRRPEKSRP